MKSRTAKLKSAIQATNQEIAGFPGEVLDQIREGDLLATACLLILAAAFVASPLHMLSGIVAGLLLVWVIAVAGSLATDGFGK